jgi:microcystin-dependent protein
MSSPFVGEIRIFGFNFPPRGWAMCNGQLLTISQNAALFSLLGTQYGGNGVQNFALPNLQSRTPLHFGNGGGAGTTVIGETGGAESVTINASTMPAHTHAFNATTTTANKRPPVNHFLAADTASKADYYTPPANLVPLASGSLASAGGNQAHGNIQPYLAVNICIALQGIFPSRN